MFDFDFESLDLSAEARQGLILLLNLLEKLKSENGALQAQVQPLRDEINRLKGEQAKPNIKPNQKQKPEQESQTEPATNSPKNQYSSKSQRQQIPDRKSGSPS